MSHNIVLSGVQITDLDTLEQAVKNVTGKSGTKLVRNQKNFRTYHGQDTRCDHAIVLEGARFDIGLKKSKDGGYALIGDFSMLSNSTNPFFVSALPARANPHYSQWDQDAAKRATGRLVQEYALLSAENQAAMLGRKTERVPGKNGAIMLKIME